ncbi:MAG TPA: hypothetical protein VKM72_35445 [Thermoanaerobaculia bacterium]|nr:hypothetical protein [Thermoanaerobaculia bacterium]
MIEKAVERPTKQDLDQLLEKTRERIAYLFRRHRCSPETATGLLREAVTALAHRWSRVRNREQWLFDRIETAVLRTVKEPPLK